jgi:2-polyprenyl-3-methyl-5-hydroxy-6-metoxy-1,4-benzoquinol methylase
MNNINEIKQFYDDAVYLKLDGFIHTNPRIEHAWESLISIFKFKKPKKILEIGSGIGEICYRLASTLGTSSVVGFDISGQSIKVASELFVLPNLSFVRADSITEVVVSNQDKYDLIFLMDVYEHIPLTGRDELHQFIANNISGDGFVFISCPTPQHLEYLKIHNPSQIQPIDENISLEVLLSFSKQTQLKLIQYKEVCVWRAADYFHAIFSNYLAMQPFSDFEHKRNEHIIGLKNEVLRKFKSSAKKSDKIISESLIQEKKELIRKTLGIEFLNRIETFRK